MLELTTATKAKMLDVVVLSQKNRQPDENPGAKMSIELTLSNEMLAHFDGSLKSFLYTRAGGSKPSTQAQLDGVPEVSDAPNLTAAGQKIGRLQWNQELTGYTMTILLGIQTKRSNVEIKDCTLSHWRLQPKEGGTFVAKVDVESADVGEQVFGKLAKLKSREIQITLAAPVVAQQDIEGSAGPVDPPRGGAQPDADWPFPTDNASPQTPEGALAAAVEKGIAEGDGKKGGKTKAAA
jgi:hypothetical protein